MPPVAVAIGMGAIGAGTSLVGAKMASNASHDAAKLQQDSTNRAQAFNQQVYQDQQKLMNPYVQAGQYSLANLMARQYGGSPNQFGPPQGYGAPMGQAPAQGYSPMLPPQGQNPTLASMGGPQGQPQMPQGGPQPPQGAQGDMVTLQGPDGSTKQVPRQMAQIYIQHDPRIRMMS